MALDEADLFGRATKSKRAIEEDPEDKRKLLRRYDHLAVQALNPFGVSEVDKASLPQLWQLIKAGNKTTCYFAEWADANVYRKGIAVSRLSEVLVKTIEILKDQKFGLLLDKKILTSALDEAKRLLPHVTVLNGGKASQTEKKITMSNLGQKDCGPTRSHTEVEASAKFLYQWLSQEQSTLRGLMAFLSQGGVFYSASCAEKAARSYVKCSSDTEKDFLAAALARLCKTDAPEEAAPDDTSILFETPVKEQKKSEAKL